MGPVEHDLADHGNLLVRRAILRDDWISEKIFDLAAGDQNEWDTQQWDTLIKELKSCDLRIKDWIILYT